VGKGTERGGGREDVVIDALCAHLRLLVEAAALKALHPTSRQAVHCYEYRRRLIAFTFPMVSVHRVERIAREHAAVRIAKGHGRTIRRAKRAALERRNRAEVQEMLAAVSVMGGA
jgi:hypothetical protein